MRKSAAAGRIKTKTDDYDYDMSFRNLVYYLTQQSLPLEVSPVAVGEFETEMALPLPVLMLLLVCVLIFIS